MGAVVIASGEEDAFWINSSATEQASQQGVGPIDSIDELAAPDLFTDEDIDASLPPSMGAAESDRGRESLDRPRHEHRVLSELAGL